MANNENDVRCGSLRSATDDGTVQKIVLADVGLDGTHHHYIVFIKIDPKHGDPCTYFPIKPGTVCKLIRPNDAPVEPGRSTATQGPTDEINPKTGQRQLYNWYMMSCPHDIPCPLEWSDSERNGFK